MNLLALTNSEKVEETRLKFSQGSVAVLYKMTNYEEAKVKLTNTLLKKLKSVEKHKHVTSLYIFILFSLTFSKDSFI